MRRYTLAALAVLLVLLPSQQALQADQAPYTVEDLGTTPDGLVPTITGLNVRGQVAGYVTAADGNFRAVRYTNGVGWEYLRGIDGYSVANGINAAGDVVGYYFTPDGQFLAFRYRDGSGVENVLPVGSGAMTLGYAINDAGDVVGMSMTATGEAVAFRASPGLPSLALPFLQACAINNAGQIAGYRLDATGTPHAVRLDPGSDPLSIDSFDGPAGYSYACAIDADGGVGGQANAGGVPHAFVYRPGEPLANLDTFGSSNSIVMAIADGVSVGAYGVADGSFRAFVHTAANGSSDLNGLLQDGSGWLLAQAKGVNAGGQIVGDGLLNGQPRAFRLTPAGAPKDTTAPVFTSLTATPSSVFPPKGQQVSVTVSATATDDSGLTPVCTLASVTGPGAAPVDFNVTGANTATVRAVGGRTYTMNEVCVDASNNVASSSVDVTILPDTTAPVIASVAATPSRVWPPNDALVPVVVAVTATDDVDDQPSCALTGITSSGATADDFAIRGTFSGVVRAVGGRTYTLTVSCSDTAGNRSAASTSVIVPPDTTAPVICDLSATPSTIWPPNGKMVPVTVSVTATDDVDASPSCALTSITGGDAVITGQFTASVRASKNNDNNRTYQLTVSCSDRAHNTSVRTVTVTVTKDEPVYYSMTSKGKGSKY
jgi:probable HAF family extracellular repeat protein